MSSSEAERSSAEAILITEAAQGFIEALDFNIGAGVNISFRTGVDYRVSYIPARLSPLTDIGSPCLEVNASGVVALFYARAAAEKGHIEIARTILLSGHSGAGESEIGIQRALSLDETIAAAAIAMRPSLRDVVSALMGLTLDEELELSDKRAELLAEARKLEAKNREAADAVNKTGILHAVFVERPASRE